MSVKTIKGSRQKNTTGGYADYIPFGADGEYVDMLSGLNLERELKLGGDHLTSITEQNGITVITQKYADSESTGKYYKVITTISEGATGTTITSELHWLDNAGTDVLKNTKTIVIADEDTGTDITEVLS